MNEKVEKETIYSQSPTTVTDGVKVAHRSDGSFLIQFLSDIPEHFIEQHRTVMSHEGVTKLIDVLTMLANYYPDKPKNNKQNSK